MVIYGIFFPNGKVYIGLTSQKVERRLYAHRYAAYTLMKQNKVYKAMRKYCNDRIYTAVLYKGDSMEELKSVEKVFITAYDSYYNGYNETLGGEGMAGFKITDETRAKLSFIRKKDSKTRLKNANLKLKELNQDSSFKENFKAILKEAHITHAENYEKVYEKRRKHNLSREQREKLALTNGGKSFSVYKVTGEFVGEWVSQSLCAEDLGIKRKGINKNLLGLNKTYMGMIFRFKN